MKKKKSGEQVSYCVLPKTPETQEIGKEESIELQEMSVTSRDISGGFQALVYYNWQLIGVVLVLFSRV